CSVKHCNNLNYWDFYIRDELTRRLSKHNYHCNIVSIMPYSESYVRSYLCLTQSLSLMPMTDTVFYKNGYLARHQGIPEATLRQVIDHYHKQDKPFPATLAKYFILELVIIIQKFHQCNIIHADICPENIHIFE